MHSRLLIAVIALLATAGCTERAAQSNATVRAVALESDEQTELVVSGEGFSPGEIEIKLHHFPGRVGEITRGATADASGAFVFREHFNRVAIPEEEMQNNIIIAAFDSQGIAATTAKPVAQFAASPPATEAQ
jgi:hypothetical protein